MTYSNERRPMPATAAASEFLGLSYENVFWAIIDWGVAVASGESEDETHQQALLSDRVFWLWVFAVWEKKDEVLAGSIIKTGGGYHVYNSEKNAYFFVEYENVLRFYYGFHTPSESIPRSLYKGTVYRYENFKHQTSKQ